ncbi:MAG: hypothetical protein A2284_09200 [Deltaproteobacteria bacterium RIFOXYA12_FULL_61_11]|nr:MAG: hypothetical protein A2284_09200 [Deltaproteobacteria bacterium RIFOXYA12_FULL_61_11]
MKLTDLARGQAILGLEPELVCTVVAVELLGAEAAQVVYKLPAGGIKERLLSAQEAANLTLATVTRPWTFAGDPARFQLTCEAKRLDLAFLFDPMMAVHTSNVEPLPTPLLFTPPVSKPRRRLGP